MLLDSCMHRTGLEGSLAGEPSEALMGGRLPFISPASRGPASGLPSFGLLPGLPQHLPSVLTVAVTTEDQV